MGDDLRLMASFNGRCPLIEDDLKFEDGLWKTTVHGRQLMMEDNSCWKMTFYNFSVYPPSPNFFFSRFVLGCLSISGISQLLLLTSHFLKNAFNRVVLVSQMYGLLINIYRSSQNIFWKALFCSVWIRFLV